MAETDPEEDWLVEEREADMYSYCRAAIRMGLTFEQTFELLKLATELVTTDLALQELRLRR